MSERRTFSGIEIVYCIWVTPIKQGAVTVRRLVGNPDVGGLVSEYAEVNVVIIGIGELEPSQSLKTRATATTKIRLTAV